MNTLEIVHPEGWADYELIDSGDGEKLERFGAYIMIRPDPRIIWTKTNPSAWNHADATYIRSSQTEGHWEIKNQPPENWHITFRTLVFSLKPTEFKHTGIFPEQAVNWDWMQEVISGQKIKNPDKEIKLLNLFAYTLIAQKGQLIGRMKILSRQVLRENLSVGLLRMRLNSSLVKENAAIHTMESSWTRHDSDTEAKVKSGNWKRICRNSCRHAKPFSLTIRHFSFSMPILPTFPGLLSETHS
jgi:hypothetical protein